MSSKYEFIDGEKANYPIVKMCQWAEVSKFGFYEWRNRPASATAAERRTALRVRIIAIFADADGASGHRRVYAQLERDGVEAGPELVRQIMAAEGLVACQPRPLRTTTIADGEAGGPVDGVSGTSPRRHLGSSWSVTHLRADVGRLGVPGHRHRLLHTMVVGYAMADHMRTSLVIDALAMACRMSIWSRAASFIRIGGRNTRRPTWRRTSRTRRCWFRWVGVVNVGTTRWRSRSLPH